MWKYHQNNDIGDPTLSRIFLVKWQKNYTVPQSIFAPAVQEWIKTHGKAKLKGKENTTFLAQKSHARALLASAKTEEEYFSIMQQLVQHRTGSPREQSEPEEEEEYDGARIFASLKNIKV